MARKPKPAPIYDRNKKSYRLNFCINGKQYRRYYIPERQMAYAIQSEINSLVMQYRYGFVSPQPGVSLADFIFETIMQKHAPVQETMEDAPDQIFYLSQLLKDYESYLTPPCKSLNTCKMEIIHINHLRKFLENDYHRDPLLEEVSVSFFKQYKQFRYRQGVCSDTVNKELATFQYIFQGAVTEGLITQNVLKDVKRDKTKFSCDRFRTHSDVAEFLSTETYSEKEKRDFLRFRYFKPKEIQELLILAENKPLYPILAVYAYTGIRRSELINLEWADVDFKSNVIAVGSNKQSMKRQRVKRSIQMHLKLADILKMQKYLTGKFRWVFAKENGNQLSVNYLREALKSLVKDTKFEGIGYHAFRHSLASNLAAEGVDQRIIDAIMGHQTKEMRQRYQHLFPEIKRQEISKLNYL